LNTERGQATDPSLTKFRAESPTGDNYPFGNIAIAWTFKSWYVPRLAIMTEFRAESPTGNNYPFGNIAIA